MYVRLNCSFVKNTFIFPIQTFHKCCILLHSKNKWWIVSILLLHKLQIPFEYPMRKSLCSVNTTLCINFHWNSLQLLKQYEPKTLFQIDFQFIALSWFDLPFSFCFQRLSKLLSKMLFNYDFRFKRVWKYQFSFLFI